jgi:antitoxin Phd
VKTWPVQEAQAHFDEMLDLCLAEGPQLVSRFGEAEAVLVPLADWHALHGTSPDVAIRLLLAPEPRFELDLPDRSALTGRAVPDLGV